MLDFRKYIPPNIRREIKIISDEMGDNDFSEYYNRVFIRMYEMRHKEKLYVLKEVRPDNYSLFIKCVCACISEFSSYGIYDFLLEDNATVIYRI